MVRLGICDVRHGVVLNGAAKDESKICSKWFRVLFRCCLHARRSPAAFRCASDGKRENNAVCFSDALIQATLGDVIGMDPSLPWTSDALPAMSAPHSCPSPWAFFGSGPKLYSPLSSFSHTSHINLLSFFASSSTTQYPPCSSTRTVSRMSLISLLRLSG